MTASREPAPVIAPTVASPSGAARPGAQLAQGVLIAEVSKELPFLTLVECGVVGIFDRAEATPERVSGTVVAAGVGKAVRSGDRLGRLVELVRRTQRDVLAPLGMNTAGFFDREVNVLRLVADGAYRCCKHSPPD